METMETLKKPDDVIDRDEDVSQVVSELDAEIWGTKNDNTRNIRERPYRGRGRGIDGGRRPEQTEHRGRGRIGARGGQRGRGDLRSLPGSHSPPRQDFVRGRGRGSHVVSSFERGNRRPYRERGRGRGVGMSRSPPANNFEHKPDTFQKSRSPSQGFERDGRRPPRGRGRGRGSRMSPLANKYERDPESGRDLGVIQRSPSPMQSIYMRGRGRGANQIRSGDFEQERGQRDDEGWSDQRAFDRHGDRWRENRVRGSPPLHEREQSPVKIRRMGSPSEEGRGQIEERNLLMDDREDRPGRSWMYEGERRVNPERRADSASLRNFDIESPLQDLYSNSGEENRRVYNTPFLRLSPEGRSPAMRERVSPGRRRMSPAIHDRVSPGRGRGSPPVGDRTSPGRRRLSPPIRDRISPRRRRISPTMDERVSPGRRRISPAIRDKISPGRRKSSPATRGMISPGRRRLSPSIRSRISPGRRRLSPAIRERISPGRRRLSPAVHDRVSPGRRRRSPAVHDRVSPGRRRRRSPAVHDRVSPGRRRRSPAVHDRVSPGRGRSSPAMHDRVSPGRRDMSSAAVHSRGSSPGRMREYGFRADERMSNRNPNSERMDYPPVRGRDENPGRKRMYGQTIDEGMQSPGRTRMTSPLSQDRGPSPRRRRLNSPPVHGRSERPWRHSRSRSPGNPRFYRDNSQMHPSDRSPSWKPPNSSHAHGRQEIPMDISRSESPEPAKIQRSDDSPQKWRSRDQGHFKNDHRNPSDFPRTNSPGRRTANENSFELRPVHYGPHSPSLRMPDHRQMLPSHQGLPEIQPIYREETSHRTYENLPNVSYSHGSIRSIENQPISYSGPQMPAELERPESWNAPILPPPPQFQGGPALGAVNFLGEGGPAISQSFQANNWAEGTFPMAVYNPNGNEQIVGAPPTPPFPTWPSIGNAPVEEPSPAYYGEHQGNESLPFAREGDCNIPGNFAAMSRNSNWAPQSPLPLGESVLPYSYNSADSVEESSPINRRNRREPIVLSAQPQSKKKLSKYLCNEVSTNVCGAAFFNPQVRMYKNVRKAGQVIWWCVDEYTEKWVDRQVAKEYSLKRIPYHIVKFSEVNRGGHDSDEHPNSFNRRAADVNSSNESEPIALCSKYHPKNKLSEQLCNGMLSAFMIAARSNPEVKLKSHLKQGLIIWWYRDQFTEDWLLQRIASSELLKSEPFKILKWCDVRGGVKEVSVIDSLNSSSFSSNWDNQSRSQHILPAPSSFLKARDTDERDEMKTDLSLTKRQPIALRSKTHPKARLSEKFITEIRLEISEAALSNPRARIHKSFRIPGILVWCCADEFTEGWIVERVTTSELTRGVPFRIDKFSDAAVKPKKANVKVFIPISMRFQTADDIMAAFKTQCGFPIHKWKILNNKVMNESQFFFIKIDAKTLRMLEDVNMRPFFGDRRVKFTLVE